MHKLLFTSLFCISALFSSAQNYVLDFSGTDHVAVDSSFTFNNLTQLSYSMWVKSDWQGANYLVDLTDDPAGYADPNGGWRTFIGRFNGNFIFSQYYRGANVNNVLDIDSKAGEYVHIACVIRRVGVDGSNFDYEMATYLNGVVQDRDTIGVRARTTAEAYLAMRPNGPKVLGARFNLRNNNFLTGQMDDFAIYNRALTETEIKDIACTGITPVNNRTILYYPFNEGSGFVSGDSSGNAFNGQNNQPFFLRESLPNLSTVNPTADFTATAFQESYFARFQNLSVNQDISVWNFGDGVVDTNNNNFLFHQFPSSDTFNVCLDVSASCGGSDQFCSDVIISCPFPNASFNYIYQDLSFAGSVDSTTADSLVWDLGDGTIISNSNTVLHNFRFDGKKTICLYVYNNCGIDTICKSFDAVFSSTNEELENTAINIYSLSFEKSIVIKHSSNDAVMEYRLFDVKGSLLQSGSSYSKNELIVPVNYTGIIIAEVSDGNNLVRKKLFVD